MLTSKNGCSPAAAVALRRRGLASALPWLVLCGLTSAAWLARDACYEAVAGAGLHIAETDTAVALLTRRTWVPSPVVRWSGRTPFRARASAMVADARWRTQRGATVMRIAFHPSDLDHPASARSATGTLERWLGDRTPTRYTDLTP